MKNLPLYLVAISAVAVMSGCVRENMQAETTVLPSINDVAPSAWAKLNGERIYFGHQSVGDNVLSGIEDIMKANGGIRLKIMKTTDTAAFNGPVFAHSYVGTNGDPGSKIEAFRKIMESGVGGKAGIAFVKLCFWDIRSRTDVEKTFALYRKTLTELKAEYPKTVFVHFTVPLMSYPGGLSNGVKRLFGLPVGPDLDNMRRNELNRLILKEYGGKEPVFDIALVESTLPDGTRAFFTKNGERYYCLAQRYSRDGGHLNEEGKRLVAEQLLIRLTRLTGTDWGYL
ncbi:MAG: SGNH/GDSL hydrolase family protein [Deltaproteobacteria bacterium]|nr:SGNH/GDSL hydrolase family protein [Deltaproteobacteria bacterium]